MEYLSTNEQGICLKDFFFFFFASPASLIFLKTILKNAPYGVVESLRKIKSL